MFAPIFYFQNLEESFVLLDCERLWNKCKAIENCGVNEEIFVQRGRKNEGERRRRGISKERWKDQRRKEERKKRERKEKGRRRRREAGRENVL